MLDTTTPVWRVLSYGKKKKHKRKSRDDALKAIALLLLAIDSLFFDWGNTKRGLEIVGPWAHRFFAPLFG